MAQPRDYTRQYNFTDYQSSSPSDPLPANEIDNELNAVKLTLDDLNDNIGLIQRDDGRIANAAIHKDAFDVTALALIGAKGYTARGDWNSGTVYSVGDLVNFNDATYLTTTAHTAGNVFNTDYAAGKWILLANAAINTSAASYDRFEGDAATDVFTLSYQYSSDEDVMVFVNGVLRAPTDDYQISGATITFTTPPSAPSVAGTDNVIVLGTSIIVEAAKATAQAAASDAEGYRDDARDWSQKVDGVVPTTTEYSSKAYAVGGTGVNTGAGSSKDWANKTGAVVGNTAEYSAKEYAIGTTVAAGSSKDWATQKGSTVDGSGYAAREWAEGSTAPEGTSKEWSLGGGSAFTISTPVTGSGATALYSSRYYANEAKIYGSHFRSGQTDPWVAAGATRVAGDVWYNTASKDLYIWTGSAWELMVSYSDAVLHDNYYVATASVNTAFSGSDYNSSLMTLIEGAQTYVYQNGVLLQDTDYSLNYGTSVLTLAVAAATGDEIRILQFHPFTSVHYNTLVDKASDAQKLAVNPEDSQYTLSGGSQGYSALHWHNKTEDLKNDTQKVANNSVDSLYTLTDSSTGYSARHWQSKANDRATDAQKLATNAVDSTYVLSDGTTSGYSALHHARKSEDSNLEAQSFAKETGGFAKSYLNGVATATTDYSAKEWAVGTTVPTGSAKDWATQAENSLVDGAEYSAKHYAAKAATSYDQFDDRYLGSKASEPSVDNDGNALLTGALFWDTTTSQMKVYSGSTWVAIEQSSTVGITDSSNASQITIEDDLVTFNQPLEVDKIVWRNASTSNPVDFNMWASEVGVVISGHDNLETSITPNTTISTNAGMLALKRQSASGTDSPYMTFHDNSGNRLGYFQVTTDDKIVLRSDQTSGFTNFQFGSDSAVAILQAGFDATSTKLKLVTGANTTGCFVESDDFSAGDNLYAGKYLDSAGSALYNTGENAVLVMSATSGDPTSYDSYTVLYSRTVADTSPVYSAVTDADININFTAAGNGYWDGAADLGAADYAEYFEWEDGNPDDEDRVGYSVVLVGDKIRKATASDDPEDIIGIISGAPAVVGDSAWNAWQGRKQRDEFGRVIHEVVDVVEWTSASGAAKRYRVDALTDDVVVPDDAVYSQTTTYAKNPEWNRDEEYVPRSDRQEWDTVGLLGKIYLRAGQPVHPRWRKLKTTTTDENGNALIERWFVR